MQSFYRKQVLTALSYHFMGTKYHALRQRIRRKLNRIDTLAVYYQLLGDDKYQIKIDKIKKSIKELLNEKA